MTHRHMHTAKPLLRLAQVKNRYKQTAVFGTLFTEWSACVIAVHVLLVCVTMWVFSAGLVLPCMTGLLF